MQRKINIKDIQHKNKKFIQKKKNTKEKLETIAVIVELVVGVDFINSNSRAGLIPDARKIFAMLSKTYTKASLAEIGGMMKRDHTSVLAMIREGNKFLEVDKHFKEFHEDCESLIPNVDDKETIRKQFRFHLKQARKYKNMMLAS